MDVHPLHHAPRTWRDFFLHLLTITIGLFIALTLQAAVETGAVSYMSSDLINAYTEVYSQQEHVDTQAIALIDYEPQSAAILIIAKEPSALSPDDIHSMLISLAETDIKLATLQSLMQSLDEMYTKAMKNL